ncbi:hypothetical protein HYC85_018277 [Camellia sinensis]|uniref:Uncharacterized protein n=1 Tax=Camellia sinensis TaxID=4442 RepID=A0A7J7GU62_CAMSI|nr:hypothetical protein HYC85_018277 [Camellia sinensis]
MLLRIIIFIINLKLLIITVLTVITALTFFSINGPQLLQAKTVTVMVMARRAPPRRRRSAAAVDSTASAAEEPPRRKFRYIPIAVLEEQKNEAEEMVDDEAKPRDTDPNAAEPTSKNDGLDEKPDINDVPVEESQALDDDTPLVRQDLNESTLDLSLGLNSRDGDPDSNVKTNQSKNGQLERVN